MQIAVSENSEEQRIPFQDRTGLSCRVGHLRAVRRGGSLEVSWTLSSSDIGENWTLPEMAHIGRDRLEMSVDGALTSLEVEACSAELPVADVDFVRVAAIGADGRVGQWASIPVQAA